MLAKVPAADQIFYNKEEYEHALDYALQAGEYLNIRARDQFVDKIIARAIERYRVLQVHNHSAKETERLTVNPDLEHLVNEIFAEGLTEAKDARLIVGIAIESRRLDIVAEAYRRSRKSSRPPHQPPQSLTTSSS